MANYSKLTDEIVTTTYEELIHNGLPFLQIFPQMFQDANIAETYSYIAKTLKYFKAFLSLLFLSFIGWPKYITQYYDYMTIN